uniref:Hydroxysteroid dehydrogenase-like protein 2 n=1 Tax=Cacopsylla melanoneura TaxID=428564 RepID=A0A8D8T4W3_9HEMI
MINTGKLSGLTIFITGASRGIGKAIALKAAKDGANIVIAAKTAEPHPKLPGTIYSAAKEVEDAGGNCLPCVVDIRDETAVQTAVKAAVDKFGGIDILINNASAISLTDTTNTPVKKYDLMNQINARGTYLVSHTCLPYLKKSSHAHILNISPPLNLNPFWFKNHVAYTISKYGMSMCALGMAEELKEENISVNALWPRTAIYTAAIEMITGGSPDAKATARKPEIMADAAYYILSSDPPSLTGKFLIDDDILRSQHIDLEQYSYVPNAKLMPDFFLDDNSITDIPSHQFMAHTQPGAGAAKPAAEAPPKAAKPKPECPVEQVFWAIENNLSTELISKTQAVFQFDIKDGAAQGSWHIDLKTGAGSSGKGKPSSAADATLAMSEKNFIGLFQGKLKPTSAFMTGKLKISGNLQKAMKLEKLMGALKSKL